jgi:predicted hotdog family 3-hydroxylacyl-ACP dehydratase
MSHAEDGAKNEWSTTQHALAYLNVADNLPHRTEGEYVLLDHVTKDTAKSR